MQWLLKTVVGSDIMPLTLAKANQMAKANINGARKYSLPLVGGATKSYGKGHECKERKRIESNDSVYHMGLQGDQNVPKIVF